jgi:hypothetical protein
MLTRLIANLYVWIIEISLWFMLLAACAAGYHYTVSVLEAAGWILDNKTGWKVYGALFSTVSTFLALSVVTGPILILVDIRNLLIGQKPKNGNGNGVLRSVEPTEPTL